jgi:adenosylhomocysteine nucleosidase
MILAATGLQRERRIVAGPDIEAIASGGDPVRLEAVLDRLVGSASGIISIGIAGGLAPGLPVGQWVVADAVLVDGESLSTDPAWTSRLAARLPEAARGVLLGVNAMVADATQKASLHSATGAVAVDMESHIVASVAQKHAIPMAAIRVITDPAGRALPKSALAAMRPDGSTDLAAMMHHLFKNPWELPTILRTALDARAARAALMRGRQLLGPRLGLPDFRRLELDVA